MKRQRNTTQMKEQTRNTEVQINEEEIGNLPEKEFNLLQENNSNFLEAWEKETSNTITLKKMEMQRNTAQIQEQTRNTEVQINEEEIGKLPEK